MSCFNFFNICFSKNKPLISYVLYDRTLLWLALGLVCIGCIMITSASMPIGIRLYGDPLLFTKRYLCYLCLAFVLSTITLSISVKFWQQYNLIILLFTLILLVLVLTIGSSVNGALRWIFFNSFGIQPAELTKLSLFCYLSDYITRKTKKIQSNFLDFCKPIGITLIFSILLSAQPDLGTAVLLLIITLIMLFLAGAKISQLLLIINFIIFVIILLIIIKPYRIKRILSFLNPWEDPFDSGYQLIQSLISLGQGKLLGQGLGNSIQKLEYLPEAHTDFIFAIIGEELGYFGLILILLMIFSITFKAIHIGSNAFKINQCFSGFLAYSIGIWFSLQSLINIGGVIGLLPIKGLTLPFISYGGSSFMIMSITITLLLRIDFETRLTQMQQAFIFHNVF